MGVGLVAGSAVAVPPDVYLLMGQSNMSGRGALDQLSPSNRIVDPRITLFANDGTVRPALDPLDADPQHSNPISYDPNPGVGPGLSFARRMVAKTGRPVRLVPCAKGGTSIVQWQPGDTQSLFGSCIARAQATGVPVKGILWYQGESDTKLAAQAAQWPSLFATLITALRRALKRPDLPILFVRIADPPPDGPDGNPYPAWGMVQRLQRAYHGACILSVNAAGLPRNPDGLHVTTRGQERLGHRLADAMRRLQRRRGCAD